MQEEETVTVISNLGPAVPCGHYFCLIQDAESIGSFHNKVLKPELMFEEQTFVLYVTNKLQISKLKGTLEVTSVMIPVSS